MPQTVKIIGGRPLHGEVVVRGAKNAVAKMMVAALLTSERSAIQNVAYVEDVSIMTQLIKLLGGEVTDERDSRTVTIQAPSLSLPSSQSLSRFSGQSRVPILLCGPLLHRLGKAIIPMPGGCQIGSRPVNFHLGALERLGATIVEGDDGYYLEAKHLRGAKITLEYPSVGATEQIILSSVLAEGSTEITNAAIEPEIIDLIAVLQKMGAIIAVDTDRTIHITGVTKLGGFSHTAIPDRLEAGSWACAAAATGGEIFVRGARQLDLITFLNKFRQIGGEFTVSNEGITFGRRSSLSSIALETDVHPGFMTDWQPPFVILLTQAHGASIVHETVYENRFGYIATLNKMGAQIQLYPECLGAIRCRFAQRNYWHSAVITGPTALNAVPITIPDLRAGFSYVVAALAAKGQSILENFLTLDRGYENLTQKLIALGAKIETS